VLAAVALFLTVQVVGDAGAAGAPDWCAPAKAGLAALAGVDLDAGPGHGDALDALLAALPLSIDVRARGDQGRTGRRSAAVDAAATAVGFACPEVAPVAVGDPRAEARALLADPRFTGSRAEEDGLDRLLDRLWRALEALLESEGMQGFANNTRTFYLTGLLVLVAVVGVRLARNARRARTLRAEAPGARVERERVRAFAALRAEAHAALGADPRRALLLGRAALLARVGEVDPDAVRPSRTSAEVTAALDPARAACVAPVLQRFDALFFGGAPDEPGARALLAAIDAAVAALASSRDAGVVVAAPAPRTPPTDARAPGVTS
jgi:hypothetical protein